MLLTFAVSGYRSLRDLVLPLGRLTVVTGPNGSGKSSLYRALRLLGEVAQGRVIGALAAEGGLGSTLWAGPETISRAMRAGEAPVEGGHRRTPVALRLGFADEDYGYAIDLGLPVPSRSAFDRDPAIKAEAVWVGERMRRANVLASRKGPVAQVRDADGVAQVVLRDLAEFDSIMTHAADPKGAPELISLRERIRGWRFYETFRVDRGAPTRRVWPGTRTPALASDGADLAAALRTIQEIGHGLEEVIEDAFPGSTLSVRSEDGLFHLEMTQTGLLRPLSIGELSDGTLRYLLLSAALLTPRPPALIVLNEPESSLHADLIKPLGRLISRAALRTQIILVSHDQRLVDALPGQDHCQYIALNKAFGETIAPDIERPGWAWPTR